MDLDADLSWMDKWELVAEVKKLRAAIRAHRDAKGHNLCWYVPELWNTLPESEHLDPQPPPKDEFLRCCEEYRDSLDENDQK